MRPNASLLLGTLGLLALAGCTSSDHDGPSSGFLVNGMAVADIDANGLPDILGLVSADLGGSPTQGYISTRLQTVAGGFAMPARFGVGRGPANLVAADLNGDGRPDLVVANATDQTVTVRLADPARPGSFQPALTLATPGRTPLDVAVGDLDGDGTADLAVAAGGANSVLVFHQGVGTTTTFLAPVAQAIGGEPQAVTVADLDGNGLADLAAATTGNTVSVRLQTAAGVLAPAVDHATGIQPIAIRAADLDGDGRLDLLTANHGAALSPGTQGLSLLRQVAPGSFGAPTHFTTAYRSAALAVGDLNGDGRPDVAVANAGLPGDPGSVSVFLQDAASAGALLAPETYRGTWGPMGVAFGDMDGDGLPDLVLADGDIVVRLNLAAAPGTFGPPQFFYN